MQIRGWHTINSKYFTKFHSRGFVFLSNFCGHKGKFLPVITFEYNPAQSGNRFKFELVSSLQQNEWKRRWQLKWWTSAYACGHILIFVRMGEHLKLKKFIYEELHEKKYLIGKRNHLCGLTFLKLRKRPLDDAVSIFEKTTQPVQSSHCLLAQSVCSTWCASSIPSRAACAISCFASLSCAAWILLDIQLIHIICADGFFRVGNRAPSREGL